MGTCWVEERKRKLDGRVLRYRCAGLSLRPGAAVLRYRAAGPVRLAGLELPAGAVSYGLYWRDRPYNIYHWVNGTGETLACYCNVATDTRIGPSAVDWLDLELDVLVTADGRVRLLDEDEVPADLPPRHRRALEAARAELADGARVLALACSTDRVFRAGGPPALSDGARGPDGPPGGW